MSFGDMRKNVPNSTIIETKQGRPVGFAEPDHYYLYEKFVFNYCLRIVEPRSLGHLYRNL